MQQQQQQQKACSGKMPEMSSSSLNPPLPHQQRQVPNPQIQLQHYQSSHFDQSTQSHEDFFDHLLSNLPPSSCWPELSSNPKSPFLSLLSQSPTKLRDLSDDANLHLPSDDSSLLAARLRQHQITGGAAPVAWSGIPSPPRKLLQQQPPLFLPKGGGGGSSSGIARFPLAAASDPDSSDSAGEGAIQGLFSNGMAASLPRTAQTGNQPQIQQPQNYGAPAAGINQGQAAGTAGAPAKQRVRAKRGQATDPHSIAERLRRERIAERMKALQELVPNANKTDKASMLDEIIDYVKFLQLQVKVLSMSRLGGAAAAAPLMADISSQPSCMERTTNGVQTASCNDSLMVTENQVAKLMEQDMGSAMQYLQGKGLCLMPITLASAISTAPSSHSRAHASLLGAADAPSSPSMSVLTAQSAMGNGGGETSVKDAASVSKP